jgi:hypothetical protein
MDWRRHISRNLERAPTTMITCALLMGGLLAIPDVSRPAEVLGMEKQREEFVLIFAWQATQKWHVEFASISFGKARCPRFRPALEGGGRRVRVPPGLARPVRESKVSRALTPRPHQLFKIIDACPQLAAQSAATLCR